MSISSVENKCLKQENLVRDQGFLDSSYNVVVIHESDIYWMLIYL